MIQDKFHRLAKKEGYRARSVFKLKEIIKKYNLVKHKNSILDLGASPGSWMQVFAEYKGYVLGIDISDVRNVEGTEFLKKSVMDDDIVRTIQDKKFKFDVVVSDMAPKTTGKIDLDQLRSVELCERALYIASEVLREGGNFMCKIFQGPDSDEFLRKLKNHFKLAKTVKPSASKSKSKEVYYVCIGFKG